jgi:murein DD-endopeptidase MepM/ murein hydrolase activator NlpD
MAGCIALGYRLAQDDARTTYLAERANVTNLFDTKRPEGVAVVDRIGELTGRLARLEIEAAELARRLGLTPKSEKAAFDAENAEDDDRPRGGPLLPFGDDTSAVSQPIGEDGLSQLATEIELLQARLDYLGGVQANRELATMAYPNRLPVPGQVPRISSGFGVRHDPFTGRLARHAGLDIPATHGTAVLASGGGRVISAGFRGPYGNAIVIDHGDGMQTLYGHCSKLYVRVGELVMPRQKIAAVGSTGRSTGPHLHFEVIRNGERVAPGQVLTNVLARNSN